MRTYVKPFKSFHFRIPFVMIGLGIIMICVFLNAHCRRTSEIDLTNKELNSIFKFAYYPSLQKLQISFDYPVAGTEMSPQKITARVKLFGTDKIVVKKGFRISRLSESFILDLPKLEDGSYVLSVGMNNGKDLNVERVFQHKNFPWLNNKIGISDKVYPPFEPIKLNGNEVSVVMRSYTMNGFGLWNNVKSEGKEILDGPVVLHVVTDKGEHSWNFKKGNWIVKSDNKVVFQSEAESDPVKVQSTSTIEYDGCMKVEMTLLPGKSKLTIHYLWLEVPIKNSEAPLFHYNIAPEIRRNYAGATPHGGKITWTSFPGDSDPPSYPRGADAPVWKAEPGSEDGVVWTNRDIRPWEHVWKTDFVPYIWLGGGTRGIAWFGASPRGYQVDSKGIMQRIERDGSTLRLKVDLINKPVRLKDKHLIIFGLQASPTKPMPKDWRSNVAVPGIDIGVHCAVWGAHACGDKYPDDADFRVVDEIIKVRKTGILDTSVFRKLDQERSAHFKSMTNHQDTTWLAWVIEIAKANQALTLEQDKYSHGYLPGVLSSAYRYHVDGGKHEVNPLWNNLSGKSIYPERVTSKIKDAPITMYYEEHASTIVNEEWVVYQDEWRGRRIHETRQEYVAEPQRATNNFGVGRQGFPPSYRDFAIWYANEWMKRGVSIYCDNVYLHMIDNPLTSEAFIDEEGDLQPAARLWDLREYHKRMWQLKQEWNLKSPPYPIMITHHMSNSFMLPVHTWNDATLDLEYPFRNRTANPFSAEYLLAQATGHQIGSYRHLLNSLLRVPGGVYFKDTEKEMDKNMVRTEWGMRIVHEAPRWLFPHENFSVFEPASKLEKSLWEFGYGTDDCIVANYWKDDPPVKVSDPDVKWLLISRKNDATIFLVLQSYRNNDIAVDVTLEETKLGISPKLTGREIESNAAVKVERQQNQLHLKSLIQGPFGTKVLIIGY